MQLTVSPAAVTKVRRAGGRVAVDLVRPVGCGKQPEIALDTYLTGKDLGSYVVLRHDGVEVLVAPALAGLAGSLTLDATGPRWWRRLRVRTDGSVGGPAACST